jgi:hypothetical protein
VHSYWHVSCCSPASNAVGLVVDAALADARCLPVCGLLPCQVAAGLHEALPEAVGLDVDMAASSAAAAALADADLMTAGGALGRSMFQYVPCRLLAASKLLRRESSGLAGSSSVQWPRAQVRACLAASR